MKRKLYIFLTTVFMLSFMAINPSAIAQAPPHVDMQHQQNGDQKGNTGGGAPVGSGTLILTLLATAYGGRKSHMLRRTE